MYRFAQRSAVLVLVVLLAATLAACGGSGADEGDSGTTSPEAATNGSPDQEALAETEVVGLPAEFPVGVPLHPGTVTEYVPTEVTGSSTVHQLYVESQASFDDVLAWYQTSLPAGWSVRSVEDVDDEGTEAKIALEGSDYTPPDAGGVEDGALVGVFVNDDATLIVTTVSVMGTP